MGWGVGDAETFEAVLEDRLNREPLNAAFKHVELLNFGVPGYQPPQQLVAFDKTSALQANALFYVATGREMRRSADYLAEVVRKRLPIPYPTLQAIVDKSAVRADMDETTSFKSLEPYQAEILRAVYGLLVEQSLKRGIRPVWVFVPQVRAGPWQEETPAAMKIAQEAGFATIDLSDVYEGRDLASIRLAEWDDHPNALGHRLIADRLYAAIAANPSVVFGSEPIAK
jgi:hypothetical protein